MAAPLSKALESVSGRTKIRTLVCHTPKSLPRFEQAEEGWESLLDSGVKLEQSHRGCSVPYSEPPAPGAHSHTLRGNWTQNRTHCAVNALQGF